MRNRAWSTIIILLAYIVVGARDADRELIFASPVNWAVDTSGLWNDATNWSSNPSLPGPSDDVTIDRPAVNIEVTSNSNVVIRSLVSSESLKIIGGSLRLSADSQVSGPMAFDLAFGNTALLQAAGTGAEVYVSGPSSINQAALSAMGGALLRLSNATSFDAGAETDGLIWIASGNGSVLDLPSVAMLEGPSSAITSFEDDLMHVNATGGGKVQP